MDDEKLGRLFADQARTPEAGAEALRAIVARDRRARVRTLAGVAAVTLAIGAVGGTTFGGSPPDPVTDVASTDVASSDVELASFESEQLAALASAPAGEARDAKPGPGPGRLGALDPLLRRTTDDGITIRAYRARPPEAPACPENRECPAPPPPECLPVEGLVPELSNDGAIGPRHPLPVFTKPSGTTIDVVHTGVFGVLEGSAAQWLAVVAGPEVAVVRLAAADGTVDEMAPVDGYAVLARAIEVPEVPSPTDAHPGPRLAGTVEGLDASGAVVGRAEFAAGDTFSRPEGCPQPAGGHGRGAPPRRGQRPVPGERPHGGGPRPEGASSPTPLSPS